MRIFWIIAFSGMASSVLAAEPTAEQAAFFESKVRPLLVANCIDCHGEGDANANLRLDSLGAILGGGDSGPALVPGKPAESLLVRAVGYLDNGLQMPPDNKLSDADIAALKEWVSMGAPWPGADPAAKPQAVRKTFEITDEDRQWWAFRPIESTGPAASTTIDQFIREKLAAKDLTPNPPADKRTLIRRASFDLIGLPPTPEEVAAFVADESPDAYAKLIDRLLASPHYGERWARHWLDVVRYGQTNGYERDDEKPEAWRYRDYVIRAFNDDKPYDQFVREQLAGDEITAERPTGSAFDALIATGFYRLGVWDDEPDDKKMAEFDELDDIVTTASHAFLGLTINCARCHDHKFDPVSQADYYSLVAFFRGVRGYAGPNYTLQSATLRPLEDPEKIARWNDEMQYAVAQVQAAIVVEKDQERRSQLARYNESIERNPQKKFNWALAVTESGPNAPPTHILSRGSAATPTGEVQPAFPQVLSTQKPQFEAPADQRSTGRRTALANWIASPANPLTARVMVNRIWQHHFGRGIVPTPNDFGRTGIGPTHPRLLDHLAGEFIRSGWSIKQMHRAIMLSETYRQSSAATNATALAADEGNELYWRQNLRRLEGEVIRDAMLAVSGLLNLASGGPSVFPTLPPEVLATQSAPGKGWGKSSAQDQRRRSIYVFVKRSLMIPLLENFDYTNTAFPVGERPTTTVAPQALMLLNNPFIREQATSLADRAKREAGEEQSAQIERLFQLCLQRNPSDAEHQIALDVLSKQQTSSLDLLAMESGTRDPKTDQIEASNRALRSLSLMMLNLNEFVYVD